MERYGRLGVFVGWLLLAGLFMSSGVVSGDGMLKGVTDEQPHIKSRLGENVKGDELVGVEQPHLNEAVFLRESRGGILKSRPLDERGDSLEGSGTVGVDVDDSVGSQQVSNRQPVFSRGGRSGVSSDGGALLSEAADEVALDELKSLGGDKESDASVGQNEALLVKEHDPALDADVSLSVALEELESLSDEELEYLDLLLSLYNVGGDELLNEIERLNADAAENAADFSFSQLLNDLLQLDDEPGSDAAQFDSDVRPHVKTAASEAWEDADLNTNINSNADLDTELIDDLGLWLDTYLDNVDAAGRVASLYLKLLDKYSATESPADDVANPNSPATSDAADNPATVSPSVNNLINSANINSADNNSADINSANINSANINSANINSANINSANINSADINSATSPPLQDDILHQKIFNCADFNQTPDKCMQTGRCIFSNDATLNENSNPSLLLAKCKVAPTHMNYLANTKCKKESRGHLLTVAKDLQNEGYLDNATFSFLTSSQDTELLCRALTHAYFSNNAGETTKTTKPDTNDWKSMTNNEKLKAVLDLTDEI